MYRKIYFIFLLLFLFLSCSSGAGGNAKPAEPPVEDQPSEGDEPSGDNEDPADNPISVDDNQFVGTNNNSYLLKFDKTSNSVKTDYRSRINFNKDYGYSDLYLVYVNNSALITPQPDICKPVHDIILKLKNPSSILTSLNLPYKNLSTEKLRNNSNSLGYSRFRTVSDDILDKIGSGASSFEQKSSFERKSYNLGDKRFFVVENSDPDNDGSYIYPEIEATLKIKKNVSLNINGEQRSRTLYIYKQDGLKEHECLVSDSDLEIISDLFINESGNCIYAKMVELFGNDEMYLTGKKEENPWLAENIIYNTDEIVILYYDIDNIGYPENNREHCAGYFRTDDYLKKGSVGIDYSKNLKTNENAMVYLHAYKSGGKDIANGLVTLAHEFQHLIHNQYYSSLLQIANEGNTSRDWIDGDFMQELFSAATEVLLSQYVNELLQSKSINYRASDPFLVSENSENGFLDDSEISSSSPFLSLGRGPYALDSFSDSFNGINAWNNNSLYNYGKVASLAHYLVVNYGAGIFKKYLENGNAGLGDSNYDSNDDSKGLIGVINSSNYRPRSNRLSFSSFLIEYAEAVLLSNQKGNCRPYRFNRGKYYNIDGLNIPSVNLHQYYSVKTGRRGIQNSPVKDGELFKPYSINFYKMNDNPINISNGDEVVIIYSTPEYGDEELASLIKIKLVVVPRNE